MLRSLAAFVAAGLISREYALLSSVRLKAVIGPEHLASAVELASTGRDYSSANATPRRDMNPALARRFGIDPHHGLRAGEVAYLLNGQRADGDLIEGRAHQTASLPLAQIFGLNLNSRPTREELAQVLEGRTADGETLSVQKAKRAVQHRAVLETSKSRIGYIDLTFSAPKSVSIAWTFAPS